MPLNEKALDRYIADATPTTSVFDRLKAECEAFEAKYPMSFPYKLIPKEELKAQSDRERKMFALKSLGERNAILAQNKDAPLSEADRELLYHKPAVTSDPGFDGRRKAA